MAPCLATAAPSLSSPRNPDNPPDTTPPPPSSETQNRADPAPLARRCHRPRPASARSPGTPVSGSHACAAPIASAFSPPRRFRVGRPYIQATPVLCSNRLLACSNSVPPDTCLFVRTHDPATVYQGGT